MLSRQPRTNNLSTKRVLVSHLQFPILEMLETREDKQVAETLEGNIMGAKRKAHRGLAMEGVIASWYTRNTSRDLHRFKEAARTVAERVPPGSRVLEVAPGPGYLAIEIARSGH